MSVITKPWERVATFDEFLCDPLIRAELESIFRDGDRDYSPIAVLKVREFPGDYKKEKRQKLEAGDAADWIINRWRELRP